jgi:hypothetical protein
MPAESAESLVRELDELRQATRASALSWWFPMVVFGLVAIGGGLLAATADAIKLAWWVTAPIAAMLLIAGHYRRHSASVGAVAKHRRYWYLWLPCSAAAFAAPLLAPEAARAAAPWMVIAIGYLAAAGLGRSLRMATLGGLLGAASLALAAGAAGEMTVDVVCGVILLGGGLAAHGAECPS